MAIFKESELETKANKMKRRQKCLKGEEKKTQEERIFQKIKESLCNKVLQQLKS